MLNGNRVFPVTSPKRQDLHVKAMLRGWGTGQIRTCRMLRQPRASLRSATCLLWFQQLQKAGFEIALHLAHGWSAFFETCSARTDCGSSTEKTSSGLRFFLIGFLIRYLTITHAAVHIFRLLPLLFWCVSN